MTRLRVHELRKTFPGCDRPVVSDVSFGVVPGEIFVLVGPSGCGKTTTLRMIGGFEQADKGLITLEDRILFDNQINLPPEKRGIGIVFQDYALFPHLTVVENVLFGIRHLPRARRRALAMEVLWAVGLDGYDARRVHELSGGQQQRVALARAIAPGPKVILLDEPFSNLDAELRQATRNELRTLVKKLNMSAVLVTHDQEEALSIADRIAVMHDGVIEQLGAPEAVYAHPKSAFVAQFLGRTNLLQAEASGRSAQTCLGALQLDRDAHGQVLISVRPEHMVMRSSERDVKPAIVIAREFKGHDLTFRCRFERDEFLVQADCRCPFKVGDKVELQVTTPAAVIGAGQ